MITLLRKYYFACSSLSKRNAGPHFHSALVHLNLKCTLITLRYFITQISNTFKKALSLELCSFEIRTPVARNSNINEQTWCNHAQCF